MGRGSAACGSGEDYEKVWKMKFTGAFFEARKQVEVSDNEYEKQLAIAHEKCIDICAGNKFSLRSDQNVTERSIVESCLARLELGRQLSERQMDQINKMSHRRGPVMFCGHRK